jgi:hypothetical protein
MPSMLIMGTSLELRQPRLYRGVPVVVSVTVPRNLIAVGLSLWLPTWEGGSTSAW